jgi:hypothetical protein
VSGGRGLPEALERAASALPREADAIRPANGDPTRLLEQLDAGAAVRVLRWLFEHEPEDAGELAEAWAAEPGRGAQAVLALEPEGLPKAGRKLLRRVRHRLRSRGLEVPEPSAPAQLVKLPPVEEALDEALVTPLDPRGARGVYLLGAHPSGGARLFEVLCDDARGILEFRVYSAGRRQMRKLLEDFRERERLAALPVPPASARALLRRAAAAQPEDRPAPRGFLEWRSQLLGSDAAAPTPGALARAALCASAGGEIEPGALRRAEELVRAGEVGPWPPPAERLGPAAERVAEAARGQIIVSGARRREQAESALEESLPALFAEPFGATTADRFEEAAWVQWQRGLVDDAHACLGAARCFRERGPRDNPVARALIDVVLAPFLTRLEEEIQRGEPQSRLVEP